MSRDNLFSERRWSAIENKLSKNLGLLHKAKKFLNAMKSNEKSYFLFIHSYLTYENVAWCSTSMNKTKKLFSKQKQVLKIIPMADIHANSNSDEKMKHLDILNISKLNLYQIINIMCPVKTISIPETLQNKFKIIEHNYSTRYSGCNFKEPNILLRVTKFAISSRGPRIWNKHTDKLLKTTNSLPLFKAKIKDRLIKLKNISIYFQ